MNVKNQMRPTTCGRLAERNRERSFWQSRMTTAGCRAEAPDIIDIRALARALGRSNANA